MKKNILSCAICHCGLSKNESHFVDEDTFPFLQQPPAGLLSGSYCSTCFDLKVRPEIDSYNVQVERAKNVNVFFASQSKESRFVRRTEKLIEVKDCVDRDELILRLAFLAVQANKNALVDVEISSIKILNGKWKTSRWNGQAIPAHIDETTLKRPPRGHDRSIGSGPN